MPGAKELLASFWPQLELKLAALTARNLQTPDEELPKEVRLLSRALSCSYV